jgi:hypothetical protein
MSLGIDSGNYQGKWNSGTVPDHKQVKKPFSIEEAQKSLDNVKTTEGPDKTAIAQEVTATQQDTKTITSTRTDEPASRPMTKNDVLNQLLKLQVIPTKENQQILLAMLEHGLEASPENFETIQRLVKGNAKASTVKSAIIAQTKGLSQFQKSVDVVAQFLTAHPQLTEQTQKLQQQIAKIQSLFDEMGGIIKPELLAGLTSLLSDVDEEFKKLTKKAKNKPNTFPKFKHGTLLTDMKSLHDFLGGVISQLAEQHPDNAKIADLQKQIHELKKGLSTLVDTLTSHLIISQNSENISQLANDKFTYCMLPNVLAENEKDIELLIRKNGQNKDQQIDPNKTQIILKFETEEIGEVAVILDVKDEKIMSTFQSSLEKTQRNISRLIPEFKKSLEAHNYELVGIKNLQKKLNVKKVLFPTTNLDKLSRITTEV